MKVHLTGLLHHYVPHNDRRRGRIARNDSCKGKIAPSALPEYTITIYGAGYVGLVTAVCFAKLGYSVLVVDIDQAKIQILTQGICPFYEPGLEALLQAHLQQKNLKFSTDLACGVAHGLFQFIAVGTPSSADGSANLEHVFDVAQAIATHIHEYRLIINKSTAPVGTVEQIRQQIEQVLTQRQRMDVTFDVISNPEFLAQGTAIQEFMNPDRIIIGVNSDRAQQLITGLYAPILPDRQKLIVMDPASAELTKYAGNAYLASRISFMNEMSQLAEHYGADIDQVRQGIGSDRRIGSHFLFAGCGFGGSCFPKDVRALIGLAKRANCDAPLLEAIEQVNNRQKQLLFHKISRYFNHQLKGKTIALWGLAFKPNTDDMREASSRMLIDALLQNQSIVQAYDPVAHKVARQLYGSNPHFKLCPSRDAVLENADLLVIVTEWDEFRQPDFQLIKEKLRYPVIFDGRNLFNSALVASYGLHYYAIGRGDLL